MADLPYLTRRAHRMSPVFRGQTVCRIQVLQHVEEAPDGATLCAICFPRKQMDADRVATARPAKRSV